MILMILMILLNLLTPLAMGDSVQDHKSKSSR